MSKSFKVVTAIAASLVIATLGAASVGHAASAGLVAAYSFDEGSGSTVVDASGHGNAGRIVNAGWTSGKFGNALAFNGSSSRVDVASSASLQLSSAMTLEAWVKPSSSSGAWRDVIYKGNDNYYLSATAPNGNGVPAGGALIGGGHTEAFSASRLASSTWSHLALTYDGSYLRLYVNGTQVAAQARSGSISTSTNALQIGGDSIYGQYFSGTIDDVRVYNAALSASQITSDMATPVAAPGAPTDTSPPSTPTGLTTANVAQTSAALSWSPSSDNVGVTAYRTFLNGAQVGSVAGTTFAFSNLTCATSYTLGVAATDAAGNTSAVVSKTVSTAACSTSPPPPTGSGTHPFACYGADASCYTAPTCTTTISNGLQIAIANAAAGAVICLTQSGSPYPSVSTSAVKSADVTVEPAPGATVSIGSITVTGGSHLVFTGLTSTGGAFPYGATHTHFTHMTFTAPSLACTSTTCGAGVVANADVTFEHDRFDNIQNGTYEARLAFRGSSNASTSSGFSVSDSHFGGTGLNGGWAGCSDGVGMVGNVTGVTIGPGDEFDHLTQSNCVSINGGHVDPIQGYVGVNVTITGDYFHDNGDGTGGYAGFDGTRSSGSTPAVTFVNNVVVNSGYNCEISVPGAQGAQISHNTFVNGANYCYGMSNECADTVNNNFTNNAFVGGGGTSAINLGGCSPGPSGSIASTHDLNSGDAGTGNINGTPLLVSSPAGGYYHYQLASGSPGYHAGSDGKSMGIAP